MLRQDPKEETPPDSDLFACMQRGIQEELNVPVLSNETRLLGYGIEWDNFAAIFVFATKVAADYERISRNWTQAGDKIEAIAIDCLPANPAAIATALGEPGWNPSEFARTWRGGDSIS